MKKYLIKMFLYILILSSIINIYKINKVNNKKELIEVSEIAVLDVAVRNEVVKVYEDLTLEELIVKLNNSLKYELSGYGEFIAKLSLERGVDPVIATSIMLHETGCNWKCSYLTRKNYNVGGMRGRNGYMKFNSLEEGISAFIGNLQKNYFEKGLTTPEAMNRKYASDSDWHKKVNQYVKLIKAN